MNKKKLIHFVDLLLLVQLVLVGFSGLIMYFYQEAASPFLRSIFDMAEVLLLALLVVHILLNWRLILFTARKLYQRRKEVKEGEVIDANYMPLD